MSIDIKASRAICDAATPGPWEPMEWRPGIPLDAGGYTADRNRVFSCVRWGPDRPGLSGRQDANAAFICHARTALPAALDEIERLRAFRASLGAWLETYEDEAQSLLANCRLAHQVYAFHRGRVKAMEDLLSFLENDGGGG